MTRIIRYLLIALGVIILVPIVAIGIFLAVFDANAYKQDLSDLVREQTGRELQFQGDVSLTFYPALGMKLGGLRFANPEAFGELPMVRVGETSISVDVMSLIRFAPEVDKLVLRDLEINLIRNKVGVNNWDDLLQKSGKSASASTGGSAGSAPKASSGDKPDGGKSAAGDFELKGAFAGLDIENLQLLWLDEQAGERYQVTDLDISTGRIAPNQPFPMTLHLDAKAKGGVKVAIDLATDVEYLIEQQRLSLQQLSLALNEFKIDGDLQVSNFAKPALRFDLESKVLDVDALLGTLPADRKKNRDKSDKKKKTGDDKQQAKSPDSDDDVEIKLPMQLLRDLDIDGELRIGKLKMQNLKLSDFQVRLSAQNGLVGLKPMRMKAYDGTVVANLAVDVTGKLPKYGVDKSIKGVQVGDLLDDYLGESPISGKLNGEVNLTTRGEWLSKLKKGSNGTMQLAFLDGALNGFNIRHSIEAAKAKLTGGDPPSDKLLKTDFSSLTISGVIRNGVFSSDDLDLQAPLLRASGAGTADLNREQVDYLVNAKLVGSVEGQKGDAADDLAGLSIPVRIEGPFTAPEIDVQYDEMLKGEAGIETEQLKADIEAQKKALEAELRKEKKKLEKAKQKELEKQLEVEKARAEQKLKEELQKLLE